MEQVINRQIGRKLAVQFLFWMALWLALLWLDRAQEDWWFVMTNESINVAFYALIVNITLKFLIPQYFVEGKYAYYLLFSFVVIIVITLLKINILYIKFYNHPKEQYNLLEQQVWYFIINLIILSITTIIHVISIWLGDQRIKTELQTYGMQSELKFLRSQINPHFLFNTLNNIYALTLKKSDQAPEVVLKLSEMMRFMLYECNEEYVALTKEIIALKNYIDLESLRIKDKIDLAFEINGSPDNKQIAPLILLTFLENSFKHGVKNAIGGAMIHIKLDIKDESLVFEIQNNKSKVSQEISKSKSGGVGLVNVKRRLELIYPGRHKLSIQENKELFSIYLYIELNPKTNEQN